MADIYVRSGAVGLQNGTTWTNAYLTLLAATAVAVSTDVIWVANDHAESSVTTQSFTFPTAPGARILCANTNVTEPPTGLATTATVTTTGNTAVNFLSGFAYVYGISFNSGTGASAASDILINNSITAGSAMTFDQCKFNVVSTSSAAPITIGATSGTGMTHKTTSFINCSFSFGNVGQNIGLKYGEILFQGITLTGATAPTTLFSFVNNGASGSFLVESSDLSGLGFTNLVDMAGAGAAILTLRNCKLPAGIVVATGTNPGPGGPVVRMHNCDSGATNYRFAEHSWEGDIINENTIIRTDGASNRTTPESFKITTSANTILTRPLVAMDIFLWNNNIGAAITATIDIIHDSATALTDAEVWVDVQYMSSAATPVGTLITDSVATVITTPANQAASSATWANGFANPNPQKLEVTFTPQMVGPVIARVYLAKPSYTVYVDPLIQLGTPKGNRQYILPGAAFIDEAQVPGTPHIIGG